ncbi:hypothetical protein EDF46_2848 [Frondihabitans sp. PhB188]|uniref:DUF6121 family protein n=1 Tax=Frondihabitans sp. PhB188 TaxID=2485200 RepID=UPI000F460847|nr:DUF6121 family protein [Frondihabitans sp. PhB188]ROQ37392.1 hypothetical protein EDF46_2848 [Frondihabitans sp. PhB188]
MSHGLLTFMATVTHLALSVLTAGVLFYVTGSDPIGESDASFLLGPAMVLASMACVFFALARRFGVEARDGESPGRRNSPPALAAAVASYLAMLLVGGGLYALGRHDALWLVLFAGRYVASGFVLLTSLWAGAVVAATLLLARTGDA